MQSFSEMLPASQTSNEIPLLKGDARRLLGGMSFRDDRESLED
jgi:hypothetical protein